MPKTGRINPSPRSARLIFITGTDTGVGKTLLTGLLLRHLRSTGRCALAIKPFCSGGPGDVDLLRALQDGELSVREINPFYFREPVAPLVAARRHRRRIGLAEVLRNVLPVARRCDWLLIEGAGGLLAPLGRRLTALDLIARLRCKVIVAAPNELGTINHTLLTVRALRAAAVSRLKVVLMGRRHPDPSAESNPRVLAEWLAPTPLFLAPFLGMRCCTIRGVEQSARKTGALLERLLR
jgi:dethiobiotin synthetase